MAEDELQKSRKQLLFTWGEGGRGRVGLMCVRVHGRDRADVHGRDRSDVHEGIGQGKKETVGPREEGENDNNTSYVLI